MGYIDFILFFNVYALLSLSGNSGRLTLGKATAAARAALPSTSAGSFRVSVIHRTLIWTTGFLTCVRDHSYACEYTRELGTPTARSAHYF